MKDLNPQQTDANNPFQVLLQQLTGSKAEKPRLKTPGNVWRKTHRLEIEQEVSRQAQAAGIPKNKVAPLREKIASKLYNELDDTKKQAWAQRAKEEHDLAMEKWKEEVNGSPSRAPADLQR